MPFEELNWLMPETNNEVLYYNAFSKGFTLLTLSASQVAAEFIRVSSVRSQTYFASTDAHFVAQESEIGGISGLRRIMSNASVTGG